MRTIFKQGINKKWLLLAGVFATLPVNAAGNLDTLFEGMLQNMVGRFGEKVREFPRKKREEAISKVVDEAFKDENFKKEISDSIDSKIKNPEQKSVEEPKVAYSSLATDIVLGLSRAVIAQVVIGHLGKKAIRSVKFHRGSKLYHALANLNDVFSRMGFLPALLSISSMASETAGALNSTITRRAIVNVILRASRDEVANEVTNTLINKIKSKKLDSILSDGGQDALERSVRSKINEDYKPRLRNLWGYSPLERHRLVRTLRRAQEITDDRIGIIENKFGKKPVAPWYVPTASNIAACATTLGTYMHSMATGLTSMSMVLAIFGGLVLEQNAYANSEKDQSAVKYARNFVDFAKKLSKLSTLFSVVGIVASLASMVSYKKA